MWYLNQIKNTYRHHDDPYPNTLVPVDDASVDARVKEAVTALDDCFTKLGLLPLTSVSLHNFTPPAKFLHLIFIDFIFLAEVRITSKAIV